MRERLQLSGKMKEIDMDKGINLTNQSFIASLRNEIDELKDMEKTYLQTIDNLTATINHLNDLLNLRNEEISELKEELYGI